VRRVPCSNTRASSGNSCGVSSGMSSLTSQPGPLGHQVGAQGLCVQRRRQQIGMQKNSSDDFRSNRSSELLSSAIGSQLERLPAVRATGRSAEPQSRLLAASRQRRARPSASGCEPRSTAALYGNRC
ncbi:hypothetical protein GOODEAATRI_031385, partial [Goodea atripinnis]